MCKKIIFLIVLVLALVAVFATSANAEGKLVGWWKLDETSGTIARDLSGEGNDGTVQGNPNWAAGYVGGALDFDGDSDYVEIANESNFDITERITVSAWVNANARTDWRSIVAKGDSAWSLSTTY